MRAFIYCLPVLCSDGTFLTEKYKGTILTAIGIDCNKQIVLIAFAFVENENTESCYWFLEHLKNHEPLAFPFLSFLVLGSCTGGGTSGVRGHDLGGMKSSISSSQLTQLGARGGAA